MRTYPIKNEAGNLIAFEIHNPYIDWLLDKALQRIRGISDIRLMTARTETTDVRGRFRYHDSEYFVLEPFGDNSRLWIRPVDSTSLTDIELLEKEFVRQRLLVLTPVTDLMRLLRRRSVDDRKNV